MSDNSQLRFITKKEVNALIWNKNCNNDTNTCANGINVRIRMKTKILQMIAFFFNFTDNCNGQWTSL